jgi:GAF domain-containing protein
MDRGPNGSTSTRARQRVNRPPIPAMTDPLQTLQDLIATGRIEQAVAHAGHLLAGDRLTPDQRLTVLERRADCHRWQMRNADHDADLLAMEALGRRQRSPALRTRGLLARARLESRNGLPDKSVLSARQALALAEPTGDVRLQAEARRGLANRLFHAGGDGAECLALCEQAVADYQTLGDLKAMAESLNDLFNVLAGLGRTAEADQVAERALDLGRQIGDTNVQGSALSCLTYHLADRGRGLAMDRQAQTAFESAGNLASALNCRGNIADSYRELGLLHRARRLIHAVLGVARETGPNLLQVNLSNLFEVELRLGHLNAARSVAAEATELHQQRQWRRFAGMPSFMAGRLAAADGHPARAAALLERAAAEFGDTDVGYALAAWAHAALARLAARQPRKALALTVRATALHRRTGLATLNGGEPVTLWWAHGCALRADRQRAEGHLALAQAYRLLLEAVRPLGDEGLRRNHLNKKLECRAVVRAWIAEARERALPRAEWTAHLAGDASLKEPFERLVESGLRLNELKTEAELLEFLVEELTELSGAERVLLVLDTDAGPQVAGALLPEGESQAELLQAVSPWLDEARRTRSARLRHGPDGADPVDQRSCLVVPLVAQRELLGLVYADLEGAFGRFHDGDLDLLGLLAAQAALTLANLRAAAGLEATVVARTAEARAAQAQAEQRAAELAIINSIQQGVAGSLDFQAIVDLVGDKLRQVLNTGDIGIRWFDREHDRIHFLYELEHGVRLQIPSNMPRRSWAQIDSERAPRLCNTAAEVAALGVVAGTDSSLSSLQVPIVAGDHVLGSIIVESFEREHAFDASDVRLLTTVASSMGVALENARLFADNQRRARESAALAEVGRDISATLDLAQVMDRIARHAKDLLAAQNSAIFLPQGGAGSYRAIVAMGDIADALRDTEITSGHGIIGSIIASGRAEFVNDTGHDGRAVQIAGTPVDSDERLMVAPLRAGSASTGAIAVWRSGGQPFQAHDLDFLVGLSLAASVAMENARLFADSQQRAAELDTVNAVSQQLVGKLDIGALIALVGEQVRAVFKADIAYVALLDRSTGQVDFPYQHGDRIDPIRHGQGITSRIIDSGQPLILNREVDRSAQALGTQALGRQSRSYLGVPIARRPVRRSRPGRGRQRRPRVPSWPR